MTLLIALGIFAAWAVTCGAVLCFGWAAKYGDRQLARITEELRTRSLP